MEALFEFKKLLLNMGSIPGLILLIASPFVYLYVVKPFDKLFYGKGLSFEEGVWFTGVGMRMAQYALCIVFPNRSKSDRYAKLVYEGYDFRSKASTFQVRLSYIYVFCGLIAIGFVLLFMITEFVLIPLITF